MTDDAVLEMDIGNSHAKWRVISAATTLVQGITQTDEYVAGLQKVLSDHVLVEARIASVANESLNSGLRSWLKGNGVERVGFAKVSEEASGVTCGYKAKDQLGIDRWLAILAASDEFTSALVIADFGTALTLDFIDSKKQHQGGYIVPGWSLLNQAIINGTAINPDRIPPVYESESILPGRLSRDAIGQGRLLMLSSIVDNAVERFSEEQQSEIRLVCTGGDAQRIIPHIHNPADYRPDLVLDGLKLVDLV